MAPRLENLGAQAAPAGGTQGKAPRATAEQLTGAQERWQRMTTAERQAVAARTDVKPILRKNLHGAKWENLNVDVQRKLQGAMEPIEAQPSDMKAFKPETGTLGVPRSEMPQVPSQSHGGLVKHLNSQGISHETTTVDAGSLKPTQAEYSPSKVEAAKGAEGGRAVIVSKDGHIIDGHHQAMAAAEEGKPVKAIVLDAPVQQALEAVKNSPSAQNNDRNQAPALDAKAPEAIKNVAEQAAPKPDSTVTTMRSLAQQFRDRHAVTKKDTDRTFAGVMDQFAQDVEQGKRTPQSVQQAIERYQELAAEPFQATQTAPATHADPGQAPEVATPAVVAQSVQKAARNEDTKPSEMRKWLVGKIDEAIAVAPEAAVDFLSFDVPGDGTFKVQNSQARLQEFRKKVMTSPGFKDGGQKQNTKPLEQVDSAINGSGSTVEAIRNFLADGDVQSAIEFAKLKGVEFTPVEPRASMTANGKFKRVPASVKSSVPSVAEGLTQVEAEQINQYLTAERPDAVRGVNPRVPPENRASEAADGKMDDPAENIRRGNEAMDRVISGQQDEPNAMTRPDHGPVSFVWGKVGNPAKGFAGGNGIAKIIAKRTAEGSDGDAVARKMVEVIALGTASPVYGPKGGERFNVSYDGHTAVLSLHRFGNEETWLLTGWDDVESDGATAGNADGAYAPESSGMRSQEGADSGSVPPTTPEVKADDVEPKIMQSRPNDWPYANYGWVMVGGGRNAPGASSEKGAKIELSKNPEWKERGAVVLPFRWNDGGLRGLSPYAETTTRYAILVRQKESPRIEASSETSTPPAAQPITRADVTAAQQQAAAIITERIDAMTAGEVNKIAKQFLPTMGKKATASKERNKAAMTDSAINLEAAAAEVGATLPADVRRVLQADMEGRVTGQDGPMFSRAPAAFSFAGQQAVTADQHALTTAQQRLDAGEDAEAVRQDTGWFKGTDGKWRFEINDADAKLLKEPSDPGVYADIFDEAASRSNGVPLGKVLDHPALFAAYPALKATRFIVDDKYSGNGSYSADENAIRVRDPYSYKNGPDQLLSVLLHEIQHGIQDIEGFASGGSPNEFRDESADAEMLRDGAILAVMMRSQGTIEKAKALFVQRFKREPAFGSESAALSGESPESMRARADNALAPHERYRRLAGEVEARNTQARQGMTDEQRRATPPSQTADVADSRVIVMFNGKEMANAPMPANAAPDAATTAQPLRTPAATIRAAITKAYGKLLGQLESKGLVTLTQTEDEAIEAAAQARAAKTGQSVEQARSTLRASVKNSVADQTQTENFQRWFKDSKVVDAEGKPLVVYHGTGADFSEFSASKIGSVWGADTVGFFFTDSAKIASSYATSGGPTLQRDEGANIIPAYIRISRPVTVEALEAFTGESGLADAYESPIELMDERRDDIMSMLLGNEQDDWSIDKDSKPSVNNTHDGVIFSFGGSTLVVAVDPAQIKSATGNNGDFDPANPDIRRSADGSIQGFFDPQTGQSFLIADNLTAEAAPGVLMHEVGIHMAADGSMKALFNRAAMMLKLQRGNPFMKAVQDRMDAAGETSGEEAAAYIAEAYENDRANAPASVQRWLADLLAAVKAWMFKKGIMGADRLTVADIAAVARANARSMARDGGATGGQGFGTAFSRAPAGDQTQTEAFKRWFKGSKVVDAEGNPLVVYHGTGGDFNQWGFSRWIWASETPDLASQYAEFRGEQGGNSNVMPLYMKAEAPFNGDALPRSVKVTDFINEVAKQAEAVGKIIEKTAVDNIIRDLQSAARREESGPTYSGYDFWQSADALFGTRGASEIRNFIVRAGFDSITYTENGNKTWGVVENTQIKSVFNNGDFDPANPDIRFSRAPVAPAPAAAATSGWDAPVQTGFDDVIYKLQDKNIDLKRVVESITKSAGHVADSINAYLKEELFHKRAAKRVADFGARELAPLMNQMRVAGLSMEDVEEYLHARHAKEANAVIAQRNPGVPGLQDGGSGMTNAAADNYFAKLNPTQRRKLEGVAAKVDAIIADTRKLYVEYGLEDQATVDGWAGMFQHYIPLMREDKEGGMGIGQGFSVKGKETKSRTGSTRKVVDILANIASQRERLIVRGEKNRVTQALVGLAQANPNPDFWEVRSEAPTERVFDQRTGVVVERPDPLFKSRENVVVTKVKDANGNVTEQMVVFNEDNPRAVRMAAAMKNLDAGNLEGLLGMSAKITRYFSAINTQYNPVFGVVNLVRDVQGAMVNLAATPLAGQQGKIAKDTVSALRGIYSDIRKTRRGGQATSQWAALWEQMQDDGGTTGYRELFTTSADRANNLKSILNPEAWMDNKWGKFFTANGQLKVPMSIAQKGATEIFGWLSDYNEAMENGVRLAAYKAALDKGMSREQAASLAKNLTVNFNRKGQVGMQAGAVYAFFNAAMQGTARIGQTLFDMDGGDISTLRLSKTGKAVVYGGVTLGVMQALALAGAGFDEEDPPEFVRERSLIIPTGGKTYVSIPMPLGLHVIPGIGRHATEFALSGFDKPAKRALSVIGMFADAFNPIGNAGLSMQTLAPTALDPLVALTENKDWTGKPIARVSFNKALPGHTQWKDTATWYSKMAAEAINWVSGGNEYVAGALSPTPDQIDYLVAQVGGGVAREASKVFQAASTTVNGEELPTYKIPLLGRFAGNAASQASQGTAFYANLDRLNALETEIKGLRKDGRFDEAAKLVRENPQATMIAMANRAERDVQKLRRDKRELIAKDASREEVRAKEDQITAVMMRLNEAAERRKAGRFAFAESE